MPLGISSPNCGVGGLKTATKPGADHTAFENQYISLGLNDLLRNF